MINDTFRSVVAAVYVHFGEKPVCELFNKEWRLRRAEPLVQSVDICSTPRKLSDQRGAEEVRNNHEASGVAQVVPSNSTVTRMVDDAGSGIET